MTIVADLYQLSQTGQGEFTVDLQSAVSLHALEIVRRVPNRRIVCRGYWQGQAVYAKLFLGEKAKYYAARDLRGVQSLIKANILTPALLYSGGTAEGATEVLIFAAIEDSLNAEQAMFDYRLDNLAKLDLARLLVREVAKHHQTGLIQTDLYLKNFLIKKGEIYTLDGDAIRPLSSITARSQSRHNFATLISKFDVLDATRWLPELNRIYAEERGWQEMPSLERVTRLVDAERNYVLKKYADEKVFRTCTDVIVEQTKRLFLAISRPCFTYKLREVLNQPNSLLDENELQRLKSGNTCTVSLAELDGQKMVVKRYNIKNIWHGFGRAFRVSRAAKSWANAHRLQLLRIATAAPIALLEKRWGFIRNEAYFITEFIKAPDALEFFADGKIALDQKIQATQNIAKMMFKLYLLKIEHGDFKATNIKMVDGAPWLIDLDSLRQHRCSRSFDKRHLRDLRRLIRNWPAATSKDATSELAINKNDSEIRSLVVQSLQAQYIDKAPIANQWLSGIIKGFK